MKGIKVKTPFFRGSRHRLGVSLESVVRRQQRRGRSFRLLTSFFVMLGLFATFAVTIAIGLTWLSKITVFENEKYKLIHIDVETTGGLRREKVLEWAEIPSNANLVALDIRAVRQRLLSQSEIGEAQVSKILPNRLVIKVTERRPIARVVTNVIVGQGRALVYALDRNGVVIAPRPGEDFMRLPEITGVNLFEIIPGQRVTSQSVLAAIDLIMLLEASKLRPKLGRPRVDVSLEKTLRLSTPGGGWVILSFEQDLLEQQIERLVKIMEHASKRAMKIQSADLTVARNVPVVLVNN